jgi:hypothetical protein
MTVASLDLRVGSEFETLQAPFGTGLRVRVGGAADDRPPVAVEAESRPLLSPELALVDPELRALALEQLPRRDVDAFLVARPASPRATISRSAPFSPPPPPAAMPVAFDSSETSAAAIPSTILRRRELAVAVIAYTVQQTFRFAVEATAVVGGFAVLMMLVELVRS